MTRFEPCVLIPTYDNPMTIERVARAVHGHWPHVVIVDDGSGAEAAARIDALAREGIVKVHRAHKTAARGGGQGWLRAALAQVHPALQVDADGQHALETSRAFSLPRAKRPEHLVLGQRGSTPASGARSTAARFRSSGGDRDARRPRR